MLIPEYYSARDKNVTYIADFSSLQSESLSRTLFGTKQKYDLSYIF